MGIKNLMKFIREFAPQALKEFFPKALSGKTIAIDASLCIYQFLVAIRQNGIPLVDSEGNTTSHLQGVLSRSVRLIKDGIKPVFIFDGKPPELKSSELEKRRERREEAEEKARIAHEKGDFEEEQKMLQRTVKMEPEQVEECQKLLTLMGIPWMVSPGEAEAQCASLCKDGIVDGVATEDMDALTFGSPILYRYLNTSGTKHDKIVEVRLNEVLKATGMNMDEFIDFCILSGCDYAERIHGIGPHRGFELIQSLHSIDSILENVDLSKFNVPADWQFKAAREMFKVHPVEHDFAIKFEKPNLEEMKKFLCEQKNFNEATVEKAYQTIVEGLKGGQQMKLTEFFTFASKAVPKAAPVPQTKLDKKRKVTSKPKGSKNKK